MGTDTALDAVDVERPFERGSAVVAGTVFVFLFFVAVFTVDFLAVAVLTG